MFIIAEAGTSHQGSLEKGYELIEAAAASGADCVKFQVVYADEIIHPLAGTIDLPGGKTSLYEEFRKVERDEEFYFRLKQKTEKCGLTFLATPFGLKSSRLLRDIGASMIKIASPELNHFPLLKEVAGYGIPLILSGGVSKMTDIEKALEITGNDITFLHCVTAYPAPVDEYNLDLVRTLSAVFGFRCGVSDHSADPLLVPLTAAALGAEMLEKHITLDRSGGGLDDSFALDPGDFLRMASGVRETGRIAASSGRAEALMELEKRFGSAAIRSICGNGIKTLAPSERSNYGSTNRSILALRTIQEGDVIKEKDFAILRSEKNIRPGLSPEFASVITGKKAKKTIKNGTGITFDSVL